MGRSLCIAADVTPHCQACRHERWSAQQSATRLGTLQHPVSSSVRDATRALDRSHARGRGGRGCFSKIACTSITMRSAPALGNASVNQVCVSLKESAILVLGHRDDLKGLNAPDLETCSKSTNQWMAQLANAVIPGAARACTSLAAATHLRLTRVELQACKLGVDR